MSKKRNLEQYLTMSWHFSVASSKWEGATGYWAWVSELPNCSTFGTTQADALSAVATMLPAYLSAALESNVAIPTPEGRDPDADEAGGTIVLRVPKSLHIGLKHAAQAEKTSLNQFALYALTKMVCQTTAPGGAVAFKATAGKKNSATRTTTSAKKQKSKA
jgi:antitoxin HicB